jgi:membrane protease YdiL (CAAX protease family)
MAFLKRHPLVLFFVLAFLFPWLIWGTSVGEAWGVLSFHIPQSLAFWIGLTLATYLAAALSGGRAAVRDLLSRMLRWRAHPFWYIAALLLTASLCFVAIGLFTASGGIHQLGVLLPLTGVAPYLLFESFLFLLTEETAWRGFALPRLQKRYSALSASLILGVLWGVWHTPLFLIPGSFQASIPFFGFVLSAIATSILTTWIFNNTGGSVLLTALFHGPTDAAIAYSSEMGGDLRLFWLFIAVQWAAALGVTALEGAARLSGRRVARGVTFS